MQKKNQREVKFRKIIRLIVKNPEKGLRSFYNEYAKLITITAKSTSADRNKVDSIVNQVLITVWKNAKKLDNIKNPEGWLYVVTRNCAKHENSDRYDLPLLDQACSAPDAFIDLYNKDSFNYLISILNEKEQEIMILRFVENYTFQEIAEYLEKPLPSVTTIFYRAKDKIKLKLKEKDFE